MSDPDPNGGPRGETGGDGQLRSYYGRPIVKAPPWSDEIPWYLFTGGVAGGSATLGLAARLAGNQRLAANAMTASAVGVAASLPLLVHDLGRPSRFHHMLRVVKPTSPMSVGSWLLATLGPAAIGAAVAERLGIFPRLRRVAEVVAGTLGPPLSTYTGVLVANTAVPTGALLELGTVEVMRRRLGPLAEPYHQGSARRLSRIATATAATGALLLGLGRRSRAACAAGGALVLVSSACQRFAVYRAGIASAADPGYTVSQQRERIASTGQEPATRR